MFSDCMMAADCYVCLFYSTERQVPNSKKKQLMLELFLWNIMHYYYHYYHISVLRPADYKELSQGEHNALKRVLKDMIWK